MKQIFVYRSETFYTDRMLSAYINGDLKDLHTHVLENTSIEELVAQRKKQPIDRELLVSILMAQYERADIDLMSQDSTAVLENIKALARENVYTVTTGQQIHFGLGPLYVLYKVLDVLRLSNLWSAEGQAYVVPIFWMATEDHDLEEIQTLKIFGKEYTWETDQQGAVGRMSTDGMGEILDDLSSSLNLNEQQQAFVELLRESYEGRTLSEATRYALHQIFKDKGLVILDADDAQLKTQFVDVIRNELRGDNVPSFARTAEKIDRLGFQPQIHIREINLFWLKDNSRERIVKQGDVYLAGDKQIFTASDLETILENSIGHFSPNVALRPLYQEIILPNLAYVGGNAEIRYWLQLGGVFAHNQRIMPLLYPRSVFVLLPNRAQKDIETEELYKLYWNEEHLSSDHLTHIQEIKQKFDVKFSDLKSELEKIGNLFKMTFAGSNLDGKISKLLPKISELEKITEDKLKLLAEKDPSYAKLLKYKAKYFNPLEPQERSVHWLEYAHLVPQIVDISEKSNFSVFKQIGHLL